MSRNPGEPKPHAPRRIGPLVVLLLTAALLTTGCLSGREYDKGPLDMEVVLFQINDLRNLTLSLSFHNKGPTVLTWVDAVVKPRVRAPNMTYKDAGGIVTDYQEFFEWRKGLFNHTDVLKPGERRNVTVHIYYPPRQVNVTRGDIYSIDVLARYEDDTARWSWTYSLPCRTTEGEPVPHRFCKAVWDYGWAREPIKQ